MAAPPRKPRPRREPAPTTPDPIELAMEAEAEDAAPDSPARTLLVNQNRLVRWQIASERAGYGLKLLIGLAGLAAAMVLAVTAWQASQSTAIVIEAFSVPPDLAARGMTGQVIAAKVLDRLTYIQANVDSQRAPSSYARNWDGEIKVEIPETGVTLGELKRELREWLGHETHIVGEIVRTPAGVQLTIRNGIESGVSFEGPENDLDSLINKGAEATFERTEPYRYAVYLRSQQRFAEAKIVYLRMSQTGSNSERGWAYSGLANIAKTEEGAQAALTLALEAHRLAPKQMIPVQNAAMFEVELGHPQAALDAMALATANFSGRNEVREDMLPASKLRNQGKIDLIHADLLRAVDTWTRVIDAGPQGSSQNLMTQLSLAHLGVHNLAQAHADLTRANPALTPTARANSTAAMDTVLMAVRTRAADEDWRAALDEASGAAAIIAVWPGAVSQKRTQLDPQIAWAMAHLGDMAGAAAVIGATPPDCYDCVIMRGQIAALAGDAPLADHWFGEAVKLAPSVSFAHARWGDALLARGDLAAAIAQFQQANRLAPRFADPLVGWGEALLKQGDTKRAVVKFADAATLAPKWGRLHLIWGQALAKLGKPDEARSQFALTANLDLTPTERAQLASVAVR